MNEKTSTVKEILTEFLDLLGNDDKSKPDLLIAAKRIVKLKESEAAEIAAMSDDDRDVISLEFGDEFFKLFELKK